MTATIPASNLVSIGSAKITVINPNPSGGTSASQAFTIAAAPAGTTWVGSRHGDYDATRHRLGRSHTEYSMSRLRHRTLLPLMQSPQSTR